MSRKTAPATVKRRRCNAPFQAEALRLASKIRATQAAVYQLSATIPGNKLNNRQVPKTPPAWEKVLVKVIGRHQRRYGTRRLQVALPRKGNRIGRQRLRAAMRRRGLSLKHPL